MTPQDFECADIGFCPFVFRANQAHLAGQISGVKQETLIVECAATCRHTSFGCDGCLRFRRGWVQLRVVPAVQYIRGTQAAAAARTEVDRRVELEFCEGSSLFRWSTIPMGHVPGVLVATQLHRIAAFARSPVGCAARQGYCEEFGRVGLFSPLRSGKQERKN